LTTAAASAPIPLDVPWRGSVLARFATAALDAVLPPLCLICDEIVATPGLCAACWTRLRWIAAPLCSACGTPFEVGDVSTRRCVACSGGASPLSRTRAPLRYDAHSRELALRFKHADRLHAAPCLAAWMAAAGAEILADADIVAPVPLHWTRLAWRRHNQAALLARLVARNSRRLCVPDLLIRRRRTPPQGDLGPEARRRNVSGAFMVARRHRGILVGRRVLLVDDVLTTGATLMACATTLTRAGAARVDALTLLRVVRPLPA
jgi:ComF family protein